MARVFEIASQISTPLALSGLFAAIVFFVLRQIIGRDFFPQFREKRAADLLRLIVNRLFVLSLVAMFLGFLGFLLPKLYPIRNGQPQPQTRATIPSQSPPEKVQQSTSGPGSPVFHDVHGDVTINIDQSGSKSESTGSAQKKGGDQQSRGSAVQPKSGQSRVLTHESQSARPANFTGRLAEIYDHSLSAGDRAKLGTFRGNAYVYSGPRQTQRSPGTSFVRFEYGLAVYFKFDLDWNPGSRGEHSFFIHMDETDPGRVKEWRLAEHYARGTSCWKESRWANPEDRCKVIPLCSEPSSGIGSVWRCEAAMSTALGKPLMCEANFNINIQEFENGYLIVDVPEFDSGPCHPQPSETNVESFVLFRKIAGNYWQGEGSRLAGQYVPVWTNLRHPIWTCTGVSDQLCKHRFEDAGDSHASVPK